MIVNKKFDRFKQWAGERMGGEVKTNVSEDFKALEEEMTLRHEGMEKLQKSMTSYIKSISKTKEADEKDKSLPIGYLGSTMVSHGEDFDRDSEFGACLISMGRTNERLARIQESYITKATSTWLESLERSLAQMKEYQAARKKLETRRLAYDASLTKMQKAKREDFRVEEELRAQKAKYEESNEDVFRRMQDIKETEVESVAELSGFLEAELEYHDRCREALLKLKRDWPAAQSLAAEPESRHPGRGPRSQTFGVPYDSAPLAAAPPPRPTIRSKKTTSTVGSDYARSDVTDGMDYQSSVTPRKQSADETNSVHASRGASQFKGVRLPRSNTDPPGQFTKPKLHQVSRISTNGDLFADASEESAFANSSPDRSCDEQPESPTTSFGSTPSRVTSFGTMSAGTSTAKKAAPPPPPPSRAKKPPPPPPPPMKRSGLGAGSMQQA